MLFAIIAIKKNIKKNTVFVKTKIYIKKINSIQINEKIQISQQYIDYIQIFKNFIYIEKVESISFIFESFYIYIGNFKIEVHKVEIRFNKIYIYIVKYKV